MQRDMDLVRKILFYIEDNYKAGQNWIREIEIDNYSQEEVFEHLKLIYEADLVQEFDYEEYNDGDFFYQIGNLSNKGYDFLDKIRQDTIWNKTKSIIKEKGLPLIISVIKEVSSKIISDIVATAGIQ